MSRPLPRHTPARPPTPALPFGKRGPRRNTGAALLAYVLSEPGISYLQLSRRLRITVKRAAELARLYEEAQLVVVQLTQGVACVRPTPHLEAIHG